MNYTDELLKHFCQYPQVSECLSLVQKCKSDQDDHHSCITGILPCSIAMKEIGLVNLEEMINSTTVSCAADL